MKSKYLLVFLAIFLVDCGNGLPRITAVYGNKSITIGIQTLGEYPTAVERLRLTDLEVGSIVWEVSSKFDTPKIWEVYLAEGKNPTALRNDGAYRVLYPAKATHFDLRTGTNYRIEIWGPKEKSRRFYDFSLSER